MEQLRSRDTSCPEGLADGVFTRENRSPSAQCNDYLRLLGFVCARVLPATALDVLLKRPSRKTVDALRAIFADVCLVFLSM